MGFVSLWVQALAGTGSVAGGVRTYVLWSAAQPPGPETVLDSTYVRESGVSFLSVEQAGSKPARQKAHGAFLGVDDAEWAKDSYRYQMSQSRELVRMTIAGSLGPALTGVVASAREGSPAMPLGRRAGVTGRAPTRPVPPLGLHYSAGSVGTADVYRPDDSSDSSGQRCGTRRGGVGSHGHRGVCTFATSSGGGRGIRLRRRR
jgi:hypothetical protein